MPIPAMGTVFVNEKMNKNTNACVNWGLLATIVNTQVNN